MKGHPMPDPVTPPHGLLLCATSYPAEALMLRAVLEPAGWTMVVMDDAVSAMRELCREPERFRAVVVGERVGRTSGLSLSGLIRDSGRALPIVLLTTQDSTVIAGRVARLGVTVLGEPVSPERLIGTLGEVTPGPVCIAS
jgi:DNA-binding NtrC family response regulator